MDNVFSQGKIVYKISNIPEIQKIADKIENGVVKDSVILNTTTIFETSEQNGWFPDTNTSQMFEKFDRFYEKNRKICEKTLRRRTEEFAIFFPCISSFHNVRRSRGFEGIGTRRLLVERSDIDKYFNPATDIWWNTLSIDDITEVMLHYCTRKLGRKVAAIDTPFTGAWKGWSWFVAD